MAVSFPWARRSPSVSGPATVTNGSSRTPTRSTSSVTTFYFGKELRTGYWKDGVASHLGFGMETHHCMGYAMARQEAVMASKILLDVFKNPRLKREPNEGIVFPPPGKGGVRGPLHLGITFDV